MIDLHSHSNRSDGSLSPTDLVRLAKRQGLKALALTDHDTVLGIEEAMAEGEKLGVKVIPAVELSTKLDGHDVHITGLFIDIKNQDFVDFITLQKDLREGRNLVMLNKLTELFDDLTLDDFPPIDDNRILTKGNIAEVLVRKGHCKDVSEAITKYLLKGCPAYVPRKHVSPDRAIDIIHKAGGKAFLAHFNQIVRKDRDASEAYARDIMEMGADGLETRYSEFDADYEARAEKIASELGLLRSGGSDFHGDVKPDIMLGTGFGDLEVPDSFLEAIEASL